MDPVSSRRVKIIQAAPQKDVPVARILDNQITAGDTYLRASLTFDSSTDNASYKLYQFTGDELDTSTATLLSSGSMYRSESNRSIYLGSGKLVGRFQIAAGADG